MKDQSKTKQELLEDNSTLKQRIKELEQAESVRKQTEDALRVFSSRQAALLATVPEIIMEVDNNKVYTWANSAGIEFFGEDVIGKEAAFYFEGEQDTYDTVSPLFKGSEDMIYVESWQRRRDGVKRLLAWWCRVLKDESGQVTGALSSGSDITDRKYTEKALRESEENYRNLFENANEAIFVAQDGKLVFLNPITAMITGYSSEEIMARPFIEFIHPDDRDMVIDRYLKRLKGEEIPHIYSFRINRRDGNVRWVELNAVLISWKEKKATLNFLTDITERKQVEEALLKNEANYRQLFDNSPTGIYQVDFRTGKFTKANDAFCEYLGYSQEEITSLSPFDILTDESKELFLERLNKMSLGEKVTATPEFEIINKNRRRRWIQLNTKNIYDSEGLVGADVVAHDITERKQVEKELQESEKRFRDLAELLPETVFETDIQGILTFVNRNAFDRFGYTQEDFAGGLNALDMIIPDDRGRALANIQIIMKGETIGSNEFTMRRKDGSTFPSMIHSTAIIHDGKPVGLRGFIVDITERKQAEEVLFQNEKKYRTLIETTRTGFVIIDQDGLVLDANQEYVRLTGHHNLSEIVGRSVIEWTADYEKGKNAAALGECFEKGYIRNLEIDYVDSKGSITPVEINATCMESEGVAQILTLCRDITDRKRAEEERERLILELRDALSKIKTLSGLLPICASCKKIRDDQGYWNKIESYIKEHSDVEFSHGICPECVEKLYPQFKKQ